MKQVPQLVWADELKYYEDETLLTGYGDDTGDEWVLKRPRSFKRPFNFRRRLQLAWLVFKGECDALIWTEQ
jgi:hypothetical protein